jgi:bacillithiol synthase
VPHLSIDLRTVPWIRRLAADYAFDYGRVADWFSGHPGDRSAWEQAIGRAQRHERPRDAIAAVVDAQLARRAAPPAARHAAATLADPRSVAIVTGQQAGLFGGPLFTLLKAVTALRTAARVREQHGVPAVALFWVDAEDHDWDEVRACGVFDRETALRTVALGEPPGAGTLPVAGVRMDESVTAALDALAATLPATEFTPALVGDLRRIYQPGTGMVDAFACWLDRVLGDAGLVVFDASDRAAKPLVADLFRREVASPGETARLAAEAGDALATRGYHAQVTPQPGAVALFHLDGGREPIRRDGHGFLVGTRPESAEALERRVRDTPERFSPNVLLRPLVQDTLFPTVAYVAGPNELGYLAQLAGVYRALGVPMPLMQPRLSATLLDSNAMRFLSRHEVSFLDLQAQDEAALNTLLASQLPPELDAAMHEVREAIESGIDRVATAVRQLDATLEGAARSTRGRMEDDLKKLQAKILQAAKRRDDTLRRQFHHARLQAFPHGHPQEREVGMVAFLNRLGPALVDRLREDPALDETGVHWVLGL